MAAGTGAVTAGGAEGTARNCTDLLSSVAGAVVSGVLLSSLLTPALFLTSARFAATPIAAFSTAAVIFRS
ncbi:hypothetical protein GCM10017788_13030 [Amycolatopsis acidiphila]|nr:hypothetical protein GCM10017788_13030 [Amycolatopsis acidiphila]